MSFEILARCPTTRARVSRLTLAHGPTMLPTFMPVGTQAAIKGLTTQQVEALGVSLILHNTYHLNLRPGVDIPTRGKRQRMPIGVLMPYRPEDLTNFPVGTETCSLDALQDSGGFQFVSLSKFASMYASFTVHLNALTQDSTEEGALFASPFTGEPTMLTPEQSMSIQHAIGADIIMQLDDVVPSLTPDRDRVEEAMERSVRWLDRCIEFHHASGKQTTQNLFAIVQGGLDLELRGRCLKEMVARKDKVAGFAVGGLSGGEEKDIFWRIVKQCAEELPEDKPRYSMGIGFAEGRFPQLELLFPLICQDLLVCVALGIDMADCVFPTRTARFGVALTPTGPLNLRLARHAKDLSPIDSECPCPTCASKTSRAFLHHIVTRETTAAHSVTLHNIVFQAQLMGGARDAIANGTFPQYLRSFFARYFGKAGYPEWCVNALRSVGVDLLEGIDVPVISGSGAKWEYSQTDNP
ncbi:Queuine tRNA-ribosyltransferase [Mycena kentingensis (nom. inval.)]|nr:Queuine tRNA-ribosyltransferase [Mycena kentingensis (nom. inval.)]